MRHILVDRARMRATARHGGGLKRVSLDDNIVARDDQPETLLAIDAACARLAETSPRLARLVELRFFGGLSEQEVATELGVTVRTVQRDWVKARGLLAEALSGESPVSVDATPRFLDEPAATRFASLWEEDDDNARFRAAISERYELETEIGRGGMAAVYRARDRRDGVVAIKVLRAATTTGGAARFRREIALTAALRHPRILPLLDSGECDGRLWYTMPLVAGESLGARLRREGRLSIDDTIRILSEICEGLVAAHDRGVIHRDLKPDNILLGPGAVIADFGIAKAMLVAMHGDVSAARTDEIRTATGVGLGTPAYMSPEQAAGVRSIDHRADLYALGVIAYEMLTGSTPFPGDSRQTIITAHLARQPEPPSRRRPEILPTLDALVMQLLEKEASRRPASAFEVASRLAQR
jgi:serine/threonine-protein kinase